MARTLATLAASSWLSLLGAIGAGAEPPAVNATASEPTASETPEPPIATAELPAATPDPGVAAELPQPTENATADTLSPVKEITLDPTVKPPVCRRYVPTGSRIATERCQSAEVTDAVRAAERDQTRRDIDEMRMRQATRDAARAAAQAEALRRRAGF